MEILFANLKTARNKLYKRPVRATDQQLQTDMQAPAAHSSVGAVNLIVASLIDKQRFI